MTASGRGLAARSRSRSLAGATQDEVRRHNRSQLLRILHVEGSTSRSALTAATGLNRSTVGALTSELADAGLVREIAPVGRGVGRPSIVVEPASDQVHVLAIEIAVDRTVVALVGIGGDVLVRRERGHARGEHSVRQVLARAGRLVEAVQRLAPEGSSCVGIGVSVPGVVRHVDGMVRFAPNLGWVDVPLAALLAERLRTPLTVTVGNDADLGAVAEQLRGAAVGSANVVYLSGDVGVGGGIILDGHLMSGEGGYGGEIGHMVINPRGRICRCGARGCWETEIGEDALAAALGLPGERVDAKQVLELTAPYANHARMRKIGEWVGIGVANLVNIFNPQVVIFGGLLRGVFPGTEEQIRSAVDRALVAPRELVHLVTPGLDGDSTLLGAAELAFGPLLEDPLGTLDKVASAGVSAGRT